MAKNYLAFLRGVNVGGNGMIKMSDLQVALSKDGLDDVRTYIQSGNVIFSSEESDSDKLAARIKSLIQQEFKLTVDVAVFSAAQWQQVIESAPKWWGADKAWKHNILILIKPFEMREIMADIGDLKPEIEAVKPGDNVIYQSISWDKFGRASSGKLASKPSYKKMTIRNFNTATKLLNLAVS